VTARGLAPARLPQKFGPRSPSATDTSVADPGLQNGGQGRKTRRTLHGDGTKGRAKPCLIRQGCGSGGREAAKAVPGNFCRHDGLDPQKWSGNTTLPVFTEGSRGRPWRPMIAVRSSLKGAAAPTNCLIRCRRLIGGGRRMRRMHARTRQYRNIEPSAIPFLRRINGHGKPELPWTDVFAGDIGR
jgi:hypothetical protein